jgi:hypothetical protein
MRIRGTERSFMRFSTRRSLSRRKPFRAKSKVDRKPMHFRRAQVLELVPSLRQPPLSKLPLEANREGLMN